VNGVLLSLVAFDDGKGLKPDCTAAKLKRAISTLWAILYIPIIIAICRSIHVTQQESQWNVYQKTSILVLYPALLLNFCGLFGNIGDAISGYM
jgi:hypothetical protein